MKGYLGLYFTSCAAVGALGFWGLLVYRSYSDGFSWIYETDGGMIVFGIIGIIGMIALSSDDMKDSSKKVIERINHLNYYDGEWDALFKNWLDERFISIHGTLSDQDRAITKLHSDIRGNALKSEQEINERLGRIKDQLDRIEFPVQFR